MAARRQRPTKEENFKIIFVSGYSFGFPDPDEVKDCWWRLQSHIHDLRPRQRSAHEKDCLCVVNDTLLPHMVYERHRRELQEMLLDMPVNGTGITRIVFAHCHGAKIVYEALKHDFLLSFLEGKKIRKPEEKIEEIRSHLAVITLGGFQDIPKAFAKICWNLLFANDVIAKIGKVLFAVNLKPEKVNVREFGTVDDKIAAVLNGISYVQRLVLFLRQSLEKHGRSVPEHSVASAAAAYCNWSAAEHGMPADAAANRVLFATEHNELPAAPARRSRSVPQHRLASVAAAYRVLYVSEHNERAVAAACRNVSVPEDSAASSAADTSTAVSSTASLVRHAFRDYATDESIMEEVHCILGLND